YQLQNVKNTDWEEIAQDSLYFYIGDFGNNSGRRDTLNIVRVEKQSLLRFMPVVDYIHFSWPTTTDDEGRKSKVNYNCEAMVVVRDSIFLFTKEREPRRTSLFSIAKAP